MDTMLSRPALSMMGERPELHEWTAGEIIVERHGMRTPTFLFRQRDRTLATLKWPRPRRGAYVAEYENVRLDLSVLRMGYTMVAKDQQSRLSKLIVNHRRNHHRARMFISLDAGRFFVAQRREKSDPRNFSLHVTKEFYDRELIEIRFQAPRPGHRHRRHAHRLVTIRIHPGMRWEATYFHHILAMLTGCVVFVGGHDRFRFERKKNKYVKGGGLRSPHRDRDATPNDDRLLRVEPRRR